MLQVTKLATDTWLCRCQKGQQRHCRLLLLPMSVPVAIFANFFWLMLLPAWEAAHQLREGPLPPRCRSSLMAAASRLIASRLRGWQPLQSATELRGASIAGL